MALTKNLCLVDNFGIEITIPKAYIKVAQSDCDKNYIIAKVQIKKSAETVAIKTETYRFPHNLNGDNAIKQAYNFLKQLPEFADAFNC